MEWSIYSHLYYSKKAQSYLLYSSLSNMLVELNEDAYKDICSYRTNPDSFQAEDEDKYPFLLEGRFLVQSNQTETDKIILSALRQRFNPHVLSLTIAPTRNCNFACPYCYEKDKINEVMSKETQLALIGFVKRFKSLERLNVIWYGGEPTLEMNIIRELSKGLKECAKSYSSFMVTNGYNLNKVIEFIDELNLGGLQITLDGTKETHNSTRYLTNGMGTFDRILENMDKVVARGGVTISVRMNINRRNQKEYVPLYKLLKERYGSAVFLYPAFVHNFEDFSDISCFQDNNQKADFIKYLFDEHGIYTKDIYPHRINKGCMSQQLNSYVVGPQGELYKCWHDLGKKEQIVGNIFLDKEAVNPSLLADKMIRNDVLFDSECTSCALFPSCNGGCTDLKNLDREKCIMAKEHLDDFLDIHYSRKIS